MYREAEHGIGRFTVGRTRISFDFIRVNGTFGDRFTVEKN